MLLGFKCAEVIKANHAVIWHAEATLQASILELAFHSGSTAHA